MLVQEWDGREEGDGGTGRGRWREGRGEEGKEGGREMEGGRGRSALIRDRGSTSCVTKIMPNTRMRYRVHDTSMTLQHMVREIMYARRTQG